MKVSVNNGVLSELYINGENIINPWGVETADFSSFFSLENGVGYRYSYDDDVTDFGEFYFDRTIDCRMKYGRWTLSNQDRVVSSNRLLREAKIHALEDSYLMDFVVRFRVKKKYVFDANIAGNKILHRNTNVYYQYPTKSVHLNTVFGEIRISIENFEGADRFSPFMYVRDRGDEWIIHARLLPDPPSHSTIKLCNSFFGTRPLPHWMAKMLLRSTHLRSTIWYRGERAPYSNRFLRWLNPCAFGLSVLPKGSNLRLTCSFEVVQHHA